MSAPSRRRALRAVAVLTAGLALAGPVGSAVATTAPPPASSPVPAGPDAAPSAPDPAPEPSVVPDPASPPASLPSAAPTSVGTSTATPSPTPSAAAAGVSTSSATSAPAAGATSAATVTVTSAAPSAATTATTSGFRLGAHVDRGSAPDAASAVGRFEDALGRRLDVHRWYSRWDDAQPAAPVVASVQRGRTPLLSVWPKRLDGSVVRWSTIASGALDAEIRAQAAGIASLGVPVYLALHHEADIAGGWGTPAEYRAAWRRYVQVFREAGATDVRWTWIVTPGSFGSTPSTAGADAFYPGDDVVDRVGLDAYNWYGCAPGKPAAWRSLAEVVGPFRTWAAQRGKTPLLAEFGTATDPADPGRRAAWLTEAVGYLGSWSGLDVASSFEGTGTCPWAVAGSATALDAYAGAVARPVANARPTAALSPSTTLGPAPLGLVFDLARSTGGGAATGSGVVRWSLDLGDGTVRSGTGQPTTVSHTYAGGTVTARLAVTDAAGRTAVDRRTVVAAAPPAVTAAERDVTGTSAGLRAWVDPRGLAGTVRVAWSVDGGAEVGREERAVPAATSAQAVAVDVEGLRPGTRYRWTATTTTAAGSTTVTRTFDTPGPPTVRALAATGVSRTTATAQLRVHPQGLDSTVRVEWAAVGTSGWASRTGEQVFAAASWERAGTATLTGLVPGTTYRYRVVATNAAGTTHGPDQTLTTAP